MLAVASIFGEAHYAVALQHVYHAAIRSNTQAHRVQAGEFFGLSSLDRPEKAQLSTTAKAKYRLWCERGGYTVDPSTPSPKPSKRGTSARDEKLSEQDVLDILENALERVGRRWEPVRFSRTAGAPGADPASSAAICQQCKHLRLASTCEGDKCARCVGT